MTDSTRRRGNPLDIRPGPASPQGARPPRRGDLPPADPANRPQPPAPGAVRSPQLPGQVPDRSTVPGFGKLPVPKATRVAPPLTEFGTAQRIMGVFELAPGQEDTKERWEQAPPSYEELRKADPSLLTPIRPAPGFAAVHEGLAAEAAIEGETAALPAEAASSAGVPTAEAATTAQAEQAATQAIASPPTATPGGNLAAAPGEPPSARPAAQPESPPVTPTAAATEPAPNPANPTAPANVEVPANQATQPGEGGVKRRGGRRQGGGSDRTG